jgi:hypothetical protein
MAGAPMNPLAPVTSVGPGTVKAAGDRHACGYCALVRKLSVLLPTRNRLEYLRLAVATVQRQDSPEWEIVISDNASDQDIASFAAGLNDARIVYRRSEAFVSVTENWNRALELATGDYVLMLGDDDGLMPGYVRRVGELVATFDQPDLIYTGAVLLTYPGVDSAYPNGQIASESYASFLRGRDAPFVVPPGTARKMVKHAMHFRLRYGFNMQFAVVGRSLIERLAPHGSFYQAAFPDYYAMNACFLNARRIVGDPEHRVAIGVTPKSYGFFHAHAREAEGRAFLDAVQEPAPPGTNINVGWLSAIEAIEREFGGQFGLRADRQRYLVLQALNVVERQLSRGEIDPGELARVTSTVSPAERIVLRAAVGAPLFPTWLRRGIAYMFRRFLRQYPTWKPDRAAGLYADVLELFDAVQEDRVRFSHNRLTIEAGAERPPPG